MKNFAHIAAPLHRKIWCWSAECDQALNQKLISAPVLAYPNFEWEFAVDCDASLEDRTLPKPRGKGDGDIIILCQQNVVKS